MNWNRNKIPDQKSIEKLSTALKTNNTAEETHIKEKIATLLLNKGFNDFEAVKNFFRPNISQLHDPFKMKNMSEAIVRLELAISKGEKIMVYGDYDVDGVTSVALMSDYLSRFTIPITYIPDRYKEGYGISLKGIDTAVKKGVSLIVALDCGITAVKQIAYAKEKKIDFIICDHHEPSAQIPDAVAVLNAKQKDCNYPYKMLCGCGVGFKLLQAHHQEKGGDFESITHYLQWVAIAIAADIVPMTGENRVFCFEGLKIINKNPNLGVQILKQAYQITDWKPSDLVFKIAPLLNAAGRMGDAMESVKFLRSDEQKTATKIFNTLQGHNKDRKETEQTITKEALSAVIADKKNTASTVVFKKGWHKGVLGIVASRLIETHYRPTIVLTESDGLLTGSVRSVEEFDVYEALKKCKRYLEKFGGHRAAAGLTLALENYEKFKEKFEAVVQENITDTQKEPNIKIDLAIDLKHLRGQFWRILKQFAPFGPENMRPVFYTKNLTHKGTLTCMLSGKAHIRMTVSPIENPNVKFTAVGFGLSTKAIISAEEPFEMVYSLSENEWQGVTTLQLDIKDLRVM